MEHLILTAAAMFMGFFAIMNPLAIVPIFVSLTAEDDEPTTRRIALRALLLAFGIVCAFSLAGRLIFNLFGLNMDAFRITGGILVFLIGFNMLQGSHSRVHHPHSLDDPGSQDDSALSVAAFPLAMPILAGPGTLTAAMNLSATGGLISIAMTIGTFGLLCLITYGFFIFGRRFVNWLGHDALGVITRMMGLIVAVMGTGMLVDGLRAAFIDHRTVLG